MHMGEMANETKLVPSVVWAQRKDRLYVTINVEDCKDEVINLEPEKLLFKGKGGLEGKDYEITLEFFKDIEPKDSKYVVLARHIQMMIKKKDSGPYWDRLLKISKKQHWLKTDFEKWVDEDDSEAEAGDDSNLEEMMKQMGNFSAQQDVPPATEEEDSDDEGLPDLE